MQEGNDSDVDAAKWTQRKVYRARSLKLPSVTTLEAVGELFVLTAWRSTQEKRPTCCARCEPQTRRAPECSALSVALDDADRKRTTQKKP